jgi:hypothetical protein
MDGTKALVKCSKPYRSQHCPVGTARWELPDGNRLPFSNDTISIRRDITTFSLRIGTHVENTGVRFRFAFLRYPFLNNEAIYHNTTFFSLRPNATVSSIIHCLEEIRSCRNPWLAPTILQSLHSGNASFQCYLTTQIGPKGFNIHQKYICVARVPRIHLGSALCSTSRS